MQLVLGAVDTLSSLTKSSSDVDAVSGSDRDAELKMECAMCLRKVLFKNSSTMDRKSSAPDPRP
jgi:hypothetical protein